MNKKLLDTITNGLTEGNYNLFEAGSTICDLLSKALKDPKQKDLFSSAKNAMNTNNISQMIQLIGLLPKGFLEGDFSNMELLPDQVKPFNDYVLSMSVNTHKKRYHSVVSLAKSIVQSTFDLLPSNCEKELSIKTEEIKRALNIFLDYIRFIDNRIRSNINNLLSVFEDKSLQEKGKKVKISGFIQNHDGEDMYLKDGLVPLVFQEKLFIVLSDYSSLSDTLLYCAVLHQLTYEYFCESKEDEKEEIYKRMEEMFSYTSMLLGMISDLKNDVKNLKETVEKRDKENQAIVKQTAKDQKQIVKGLEELEIKQKCANWRQENDNKKILDAVEKRNKKESRCELTQMDCARIIVEERKNNYEAKKRLLDALNMSTETIDKDKSPDEENIVRTIERWDTGKTKPPEGYSRRISEYEFREWVKKREKRKLDNWIVKIRKSLKTVQVELVPEAVLDEWMRLNSDNDNDPYSKIKV